MPASASPPPSPPVRTPGQQPSHPASATNRSRTPQNDRFALYSPRNPDRRWIRAKRAFEALVEANREQPREDGEADHREATRGHGEPGSPASEAQRPGERRGGQRPDRQRRVVGHPRRKISVDGEQPKRGQQHRAEEHARPPVLGAAGEGDAAQHLDGREHNQRKPEARVRVAEEEAEAHRELRPPPQPRPEERSLRASADLEVEGDEPDAQEQRHGHGPRQQPQRPPILDQHEAAGGEQQPDRDEEGRHLVRRGHEHEDRREEDDPPPLSPPEVAEQRQRDQRHEGEGEEGDPAPDEHAGERRREQVRDRGERGDETAHAVAAGEPPHQHVHGDAGRKPGEDRQCLGGRLELEQGRRDPDRNGDERRAEEAEAGRVSLEDLALGQQVVPDVRSLPVHGFLGHLIGAGCPCGGGIHDRLSGGNERA